ncbi:ester cyclase [Pseudomonas sp. B2M1-30]|uniref:ester cyclase n=1 Tax=Pseudomonas TaxID=286 RepID=UPI0021CACF63|nr:MULTISPECIES: ester cyclase [Pseudomonas]MCU0119961.1 ester cyclase [Pseudomonas sp. B2M1-30]MCU7261972.1 ester cyclase [Pseudomonas koreensis]
MSSTLSSARRLWLNTAKAILSAGLVLPCIGAFAQPASALDAQSADALVTKFYEALTASRADAIAPLLGQVTSQNWINCGTNETCQRRGEVIQRWTGRIAVVPDYHWAKKEVITTGSRIVVRGEGSGTPVAMFLGKEPKGRSFHVMTIDIHDIDHGRIVRSYHLEDWISAARQLSD